MKTAQVFQFGPPSVIQIVDKPIPQPQVDEILIKVFAAGVNPIDAKIREGSSFVAESLKDKLPIGLGYDLSGEVIACGSEVRTFTPGQFVIGSVGRHLSPSAYSEYTLAKAHELLVIQQGFDTTTAAALPIAGLTAWQAIHNHGKLQEGERVLIHAGAGGVGHIAVQLAKLTGAEVWTTASVKHHEFLNGLGIHHLIDYRKTPFETVLKDVDLVIDLVGGETGIRSFDILKPTGRMVTVPTITRDEILKIAKQRNIDASGMLAEMNLSDLANLIELISTNQLKLVLAESYPLEEAVQAHESLEQKNTQGKITLNMST